MAGHVLGIVKSAQGVVDVRSVDGKIRSLLVGDSLREGDTVLTTGGGKLVIALSEGGELVLGPGEAVVMTAELSADRHPTAHESQVASVDNILAALQDGKDLNSLLEATAAGPGGGPGTNEGHTFVQLLRVVENVGEVNSATTAGVERNLPEEVPNLTIPAPDNSSPDAVDDTATTPEGTPVTITVLQNDTDPESDPLTITSVALPEGTPGTVTLNPDGTITYDPGTAFNHLSRNESAQVTFTYTISDGHGGTDTATVTVTVTGVNDPPTITVNPGNVADVTNESGLPAGSGNDPTGTDADGTFQVADPDGVDEIVSVTIGFTNPQGQPGSVTILIGQLGTSDPINVIHTNAGDLTITGYDPTTGTATYEYVLTTPTTDVPGVPETDVFTVTTSDGVASSPPATISIEIVDDVPVAVNDTDSIAAGSNQPATGNLITDAEGDGGQDTKGADGASVTAVTGSGGTTSENGVFTVVGTHGVLTVNADGSYSYQRNPGSQGGVTDTFTYTLTDGDGDTATATLAIGIGDGTPTISIPEAGGPTTTVSESGLPARGSESAGSNEAADSEKVSGQITFSSPDGVQSVQIGGMTLTAGVSQTTTDATGSLTATYTFDSATGQGTISYDYTLGDNTSGEGTTVSFPVLVTDADGDATPAGNLVLNIVDDAPTARDDTDSVAGNQFTAETGNVISGVGTTNTADGADTRGADGASVTGVTGAGQTTSQNGTFTVVGQYGVLTIGAEGNYSYVRNAGTPGGVDDVFNYTLTDGDGDTSGAKLTISIGDNAPTVEIPAAGGPSTTVSESGLPARGSEPAGSNAAADSETTSGTITFNSLDGVSAVKLGTLTLTGDGQTATDATGALTASYTYDSATGIGTISYSYTLGDNTSGDGTTVSFPVVVTDADGDSAPAGNLVINIVDDAADAVNDTDSVAAGSYAPATGNVISDAEGDGGADTRGADDATVTAVTGSGSGSVVDGSFVVNGTYGVLTIGADGSYSYQRNPGTAGGVSDVFNYTLTDGDGDTDTATLTIAIGNAPPSISGLNPQGNGGDVSVNEDDLPGGSDTSKESLTQGGSFNISSPDGIANLSVAGHAFIVNGVFTAGQVTTPLGNTLEVTAYDPATGNVTYTYTLNANEEHPAGSGALFENLDVTLTDQDGQSASDTLSVQIVDDVPDAVDDTDSLAAGSFGPATGNVITDAENDGGKDTVGADGAAVSAVTGVSAGTLLNGVFTVAGQYGVLTLNTDGSYSYTRNANTPGGVSDTFTYTLRDGDGDTDTATLTFNIGNATPTITNLTSQANGGDVSVNEDDLPGGSDATKESTTQSGSFNISSPDGVASLTIHGTAVITNGVFTATTITTPLGNTLEVTAYDPATGAVSYTFTLNANEIHADGAGVNSLFENLSVVLTDPDSQAASSTLSLQIVDDVPDAVNDTDSVAPGSFAPATGNVITDAENDGGKDTVGADGAAVSAVTGVSAGTLLNGVFTVAGQYGVLTLNTDGSYSYQRNAGTPGGVDDVFTYTLRDGDGDTDTATLTISIGNSVPVISDLNPKESGGDVIVNEDDLPAGSDDTKEPTTVSGSFTVSSPDGVSSLTVHGTAVITNGVFTAATITTPLGNTLNVTGYDPATGAVTYTFTLTGAEQHAPGIGQNGLFEDLAVVLKDPDGQTANATMSLQIVDDVPTARGDTDTVAAGSFAPETGNVITGANTTSGAAGADTKGADGATVTGATGFGSTSTVGGVTTVNGQYGVLTLNADGGYSYQRNPASSGGVTDTFNYTLTDADGDTSSANLVITINDSTPTITIPAAGGPTTTVAEAGLGARPNESAGSNAAANSETTSGTITFNSPDGVQSVQLGSLTLTGSSQQIVDATGTLTASYSYNAATGVGTITYSYTLTDNTSGDNTTASFAVKVTDADGDVTTPGNLVINITDDVPVARNDTDTLAANQFTTPETGNVITGVGTTSGAAGADTRGADSAVITNVVGALGGTIVNGNFVVTGQYGVLTVGPDGNYSYSRNYGTEGGKTDTFTYTLTDSDGDTSSANLVISIGDSTPTMTIPGAGGASTTVYESGLGARTGESAGSNAAAATEMVAGSISFASVDGVSLVQINGVTVTTSAQTIVTDATGTLVASYSYNPVSGTGTISYQYTLTDNTSGDNTNATFAVKITDADGDVTSPGNLVISIVDDVPTANLDTNTVTEGASVSANVLTNDVFGADSGTIQGVIAGTSTANPVSGNIGVEISGTYGKLTLNADGSYTYKANPNSVAPAGAQDSFVYTIKDGDGDVSTTTLKINVTDSGLAATPDSVQVLEAALPTGSTPNSTAESISGTLVGNATGGSGTYTYSVVGSSTGAYGTLVLAANGAYTYTLTKPYDTNPSANNGSNVEANRDVFTVRATDSNGNSVDTQINVSIVDDVPTLNTGNLAIANVVGTFSGDLGWVSGADTQTIAESFSSASAISWTNIRSGFNYSYDAGTQTGTATFVDGGVTKTFFTVKVNANGTYDFQMVNPDPVTVQNIPSLLSTITGANNLPSYTIPASNFGGEFALMLTGSSDAHPRDVNGNPTETINLSSSSLGVGDDVMHGSKGDVLRFDVQPVNGSDASPTSLTVGVDGTASWKASDSADLIIKYVGEPAVTITQVWGADKSVTFELDPTKTLDYMELKPHDPSQSFKINAVAMSYERSVFPDDFQLNFSATGTDADGDTATSNFTVAVNTATGSTYQIDGTSGNDTLHGTSGNDTLIGGGGSDTFVWHLADKGTAGSPAIDKVSDFGTGGTDVLNVRDLLQGENKADLGNLDNYLHFTQSGGTTTIHISSSGGYSGGFSAGATDQQIQLTGVDLTTIGNDQQIIQNLLNNGKLVTD